MTDRIVLNKLGSVFAPAQKIRPLRRDGGESEKRRFERQLARERESKAEDAVELETAVEENNQEDAGTGKETWDHDPKGSGKKDGPDRGGRVGSFVDIRV